jgi:hypothetical protein
MRRARRSIVSVASFCAETTTTSFSPGANSVHCFRNCAARRNAFAPVITEPPSFRTTIFSLPRFESNTRTLSETAPAVLADFAKFGSEILLLRPWAVSRGSYLFTTRQDVAPGHRCPVAVASLGPSPLPLWISAAGPRQEQTMFTRSGKSLTLSNLARNLRNKTLLLQGQLNCAYRGFREDRVAG